MILSFSFQHKKYDRDFKVNHFTKSNLEDIEYLIRNIHRREYILKDIKQYMEAERDEVCTNIIFQKFAYI